MPYQPKTGEKCHCKPGVQRDNCRDCEGTGMRIDYARIRQAPLALYLPVHVAQHSFRAFRGEDPYLPSTWCALCNCTRIEANRYNLHIEWGVDEASGEYFVEDQFRRVVEGLTFNEALAITREKA